MSQLLDRYLLAFVFNLADGRTAQVCCKRSRYITSPRHRDNRANRPPYRKTNNRYIWKALDTTSTHSPSCLNLYSPRLTFLRIPSVSSSAVAKFHRSRRLSLYIYDHYKYYNNTHDGHYNIIESGARGEYLRRLSYMPTLMMMIMIMMIIIIVFAYNVRLTGT